MAKELKLSVFNKVVKDACKRISEAVGEKVTPENVDICLCNGYITLYYEKNDYVVNVELSQSNGDLFINYFDVTED